MDVIKKIKDHFEENKVTVMVEVPEWGEDGKPLQIFADPLTLKQKSILNERSKRKGEFDAFCHTLVMKARDSEGKRIFKPGDEMVLMNQADVNVVMRTVNELINKITKLDPDDENEPEEYEDIKKN